MQSMSKAPRTTRRIGSTTVAPSGGKASKQAAPREARWVARLRAFYSVTRLGELSRVQLLLSGLLLLVASLVISFYFMNNAAARPPWAPSNLAWWTRPLQLNFERHLPALENAAINVTDFDAQGRVWIGGDNGLLGFSADQGRSWTLYEYDGVRGCFHAGDAPCPPPPAPALAPGSKPPDATSHDTGGGANPKTDLNNGAGPAKPETAKKPSSLPSQNPSGTVPGADTKKTETPQSQTRQSQAPRGVEQNAVPALKQQQQNSAALGPKITIAIEAPFDGTTVSGTIKVVTSTYAAAGIAGVTLLVDGTIVGKEILQPPYEFSLDTTSLSDDKHQLTVMLRDAKGAFGTSKPVTIVVKNANRKAAAAAMMPARPSYGQGARIVLANFPWTALPTFFPSATSVNSTSRSTKGTVTSEKSGLAEQKAEQKTQYHAVEPAARVLSDAEKKDVQRQIEAQTAEPQNWARTLRPSVRALDLRGSPPILAARDGRIFDTSDDGSTWTLATHLDANGKVPPAELNRVVGRQQLKGDGTQETLYLSDGYGLVRFASGYMQSAGPDKFGIYETSGDPSKMGYAVPRRVANETVYGMFATPDGAQLWYTSKDGDETRIYRSDDHGRNWNAKFRAKGFTLGDISFDDEHAFGYAVGDHGAIVATSDGGDHWSGATRSAHTLITGSAAEPSTAANGAENPAVNSGRWFWPHEWPWEMPWRLPPLWFYPAFLAGLMLFAGALLPAEPQPLATGLANLSTGDSPISRIAEDALDFTPVVRGLSGLVRNENTKLPLTMAMNGGWGTGKTSLMQMLCNDLREAGLRTVWFNAWHHQEEPNLLAALLQSVRADAAPALLDMGGIWYRVKLVWRRLDRQRWRAVLAGAIVAGLVWGEHTLHSKHPDFYLDAAVGLKCAVQPVDDVGVKDRTLVEQMADILIKLTGGTKADVEQHCHAEAQADIAKAAITAEAAKNPSGPPPAPRHRENGVPDGVLLIILFAALWPKLSELLKSFGANPADLLVTHAGGRKTSDVEAQTSFRETFKRQYCDVTQALLPRRLVIFVDDLDRCRPDKVAEMLEAVNYVVVAGPCAVVLGIESIAVEAGLGLSFKDMAAETLAFRAKTLQESGEPAPALGDALDQQREFAQLYIRKLFNVVIEVPRPNDEQLSRLFEPSAAERELSEAEKKDAELERFGHRMRLALVTAAAFTLMVMSGMLLGDTLYNMFQSEQPASAELIAWKAPVGAAGVRASSAGQTGTGEAKGASGAAARNDAQKAADAEGTAKADAQQKTAGGAASIPLAIPQPDPQVVAAERALPDAWLAGRRGWVFTAVLFLVIGSLLPRLLRTKSATIADSEDVRTALEIWKPVIAGVTRTPRELKRLLNRIRYLAIVERPQPREVPLWRRIVDLAPRGVDRAVAEAGAEQAADTPVAREVAATVAANSTATAISAVPPGTTEAAATATATAVARPKGTSQPIPEPVLVALAVQKEFRRFEPSIMNPQAREKFAAAVQVAESEFAGRFKSIAPGSMEQYRERFDALEAGVVMS